MSAEHLRNVAIIAHVDHGKTSLLDQLLYQSGMFRAGELDKLAGGQHGLIMDSNDLERERGITILSKNCALRYTTPEGDTYKINLIDTPGHADFGGEVERVMKMADGVLLLVDAFEGPMPQTRFVLGKALGHGLKPVVVVNKIDRPDARPDDVINEVFDLLVELDAEDEALDFPIIYSSAKEGWATRDARQRGANMQVLFDTIIAQVPGPSPEESDASAAPQMLVTSLDYSDYVGRIAIGRVFAGTLRPGMPVTVIDRSGRQTRQRILKTLQFDGLGRKEVERVEAGDICAILGLDPIDIGNTITCAATPVALPPITIDEPTLHMIFRVNDSPFTGREGKYVTSRQIGERLEKELRSNVALRVEPGETREQFRVSGRGLMHIGVVIENMRREGYELAVGKPHVITREVDGRLQEPIERLVVECPFEQQSAVMALLGDRRAELVKMDAKAGATGFVHMEFTIPARRLMGLRSRMLTATRGEAIMHHTLQGYEAPRGEFADGERQQGVLVASEAGQVTAYALDALSERGIFFVAPGEQVYRGQIVGEHTRGNDLVVNVVKGKKLTNVRASGKDDAPQIRPPRRMSLEATLEYIAEDELVEVTPASVRMRKHASGV